MAKSIGVNFVIYIYTIKSELKSALKLGYEKTDTYWGDYLYKLNPKDIFIRWGNSELLVDKAGNEREFPNVLNSSRSIKGNCHKDLTLEKLSHIVKTPQIFKDKVPKGVLAIIRPTVHSGGSGFQVYTGPQDIPQGYYSTEFLDTDKEYRVFFCGNETMCATRASIKEDQLSQKYKCRSQWGYKNFRETNKELHELVIKAAKTLKLDFGGADILVYKGEYYFLEFNTAITIDSVYILDFYKNGLTKLLKKKFPDLI